MLSGWFRVMVDTSLGGVGRLGWWGRWARSWTTSLALVRGTVRISWPAKKTWSTLGWSRTVTIWPARCRPAETCWQQTPIRPLADTRRVISMGSRVTGGEGWRIGAQLWRRAGTVGLEPAWRWPGGGGGGCSRPPRRPGPVGRGGGSRTGGHPAVRSGGSCGSVRSCRWWSGSGPGEPVGDALLAADAVEHHLTGMRAEPTGEQDRKSTRLNSSHT